MSLSTNLKKIAFDWVLFTYSLLLGFYWSPAGLNPASWGQYLLASLFAAFLAQVFQFPSLGRKLFLKKTTPSTFPLVHITLLIFGTILTSIEITDASFTELLDSDGLQGAWRLWEGLTHPNFALLPKAISLATETIYLAFLSTLLATPVAFFLAFFSAKNLMRTPAKTGVYMAVRGMINLSRSIEPLIWALIFTVWVGVGPFAGMLALMVNSIASLTKYYSEIIENISEGPVEAIRSTGANGVQVIWYGILPQIILPYIGMTVYRWDTNVRMATVIGLVGGGGIGTLLIQYQGQAMWPEVGCIIFVIAVIVWIMDATSAYIRQALS